jgi:hypothetical protein
VPPYPTMSKTTIPHKIVLKLWLRSGGRCQFQGCNKPLWRDELTQRQMNQAYIAHIIADSPDGPRGDSILSPKLAKDFNNLMLLCPTHHKLVDDNPDIYPVELLQKYKQEHENPIEHLTSITGDLKTHLLIFIDNIGKRNLYINFDDLCTSVIPRYPAESKFIEIDLSQSPYRDDEPSYFTRKQDEISRLVDSRIRQISRYEGINHLSIFALASIPLLVYFGYEIGDIISSDVYQKHRDTDSWKWQMQNDQEFKYIIETPQLSEVCNQKAIALNLSLSGTIHPEEISQAMSKPYCIYKMTISEPDRDYLKSKDQLDLFKVEMRALLRQIREMHGCDCEIHLFPAIPASVAVSFGQLLLPKSDPLIHIYENNHGFRYALTIPRRVVDATVKY